MPLCFLLVISSLLFISCYTPRYMYSPAAQNIPLLVNKGDSKLSGAIATNFSKEYTANNRLNETKNRGFDLQGAYAITNHFAIAANYYRRNESNNGSKSSFRLDSANLRYKRQLTELAVGYFTPLAESKLFMFQLFGGIGKGQFSFTDVGKDRSNFDYSRNHQAQVTKFYFQPALMLQSKGNFAASFSSRFSFLKFGNIKTNYTPTELSNYQLDSLTDGTRNFWEPAFTNSFGFKKLPGILFEYQFGTSILLNNRPINHRAFNFSFALVFDLPKLLSGKKEVDKNYTKQGID